MKSEAILKSYILNGVAIESGDTKVFDQISKPPIYEVVRVVSGKPLFLEDHLERMYNSGSLIGYDIGYSIDQVLGFCSLCIEENHIENNNIKLLAVENDHGEKQFIVMAIESFYPPQSYYEDGIKTTILDHQRDNPNAKVQHGDYKQRVKDAMEKADAFEVLLKNMEGFILEGSRSNMFYVLDDRVYTAPSKDVLLGITRKHIIKLCKDIGYPVEERKLHVDDLASVEGMFISGTSIGVLPIAYVDSVRLDSVNCNAIRKLLKAYDRMIYKTLG